MSESFPESMTMPPDARYSARYPMAMAYAALKHAAQSRKDAVGTPYIGHPVAVSMLVWQHVDPDGLHETDIDEDLAIAALLHDVAEDAGGHAALAEIEELFGTRVAQIVDHCSDDLPAPGADKAPWRQRKEAHIARIRALSDRHADAFDPGACLVIACDKLHNLGQTGEDYAVHGEDALARFNGGIEGTRWYYRTLADTLAPALPEELSGRLSARRWRRLRHPRHRDRQPHDHVDVAWAVLTPRSGP